MVILTTASLVTQPENAENGSDSLANLINLAFVVKVYFLQQLLHAFDLLNTAEELFLLLFQKLDKIVDFVERAFSLIAAVVCLCQDLVAFSLRQERKLGNRGLQS